MVSSTPRPYFAPGKDPVPTVQETGWASGQVWTGGKSRPSGIRSPGRPPHSQSLYRLSTRPGPCINTILKFRYFKNRFYFDKDNRLLTSIWYRVYDEYGYIVYRSFPTRFVARTETILLFFIAVDLRLFDVDRYLRQVSEETAFRIVSVLA